MSAQAHEVRAGPDRSGERRPAEDEEVRRGIPRRVQNIRVVPLVKVDSRSGEGKLAQDGVLFENGLVHTDLFKKVKGAVDVAPGSLDLDVGSREGHALPLPDLG